MSDEDADEFPREVKSYPLDQITQVKDEENERVNHPPHYNQVPSIECIEVVEHFNFNRGNAIKYIWRAGAKGNELEDLQKALWYLEREIERLWGD